MERTKDQGGVGSYFFPVLVHFYYIYNNPPPNMMRHTCAVIRITHARPAPL